MSGTSRILYRLTHGPGAPSKTSQTHFIFGANTDVGKTVLSAGLVRAATSHQDSSSSTNTSSSSSLSLPSVSHYIKPLQCGGSDQSFVKKHAPNVTSTTTLFEWDTPASPHLASRKENKPVSDEQVQNALSDCLQNLLVEETSESKSSESLSSSSKVTKCWVETAGGVLSPSSASPENNSIIHATAVNLSQSTTTNTSSIATNTTNNNNSWGWVTQGDLYQPFMIAGSVILVGDGRLGGISATLSAMESLIIRGYDIAGIILIETGYGNQTALREYASRNLKMRSGDGMALFENPEKSIISLPPLPPEPEPLTEWYESQQVTETLDAFVHDHLDERWERRVERLSSLLLSSKNDTNNYHGSRPGESSTALAMAATFGRYGKQHGLGAIENNNNNKKYNNNNNNNTDNNHHSIMKLLSQKILSQYRPWANQTMKNYRVRYCRNGNDAKNLAIQMGLKQYRYNQVLSSSSSSSSSSIKDHTFISAEVSSSPSGIPTISIQKNDNDNNNHGRFSISNEDYNEKFDTIEEVFDLTSRMAKNGEMYARYKNSINEYINNIEKSNMCTVTSVITSFKLAEAAAAAKTTTGGGGQQKEQQQDDDSVDDMMMMMMMSTMTMIDPLWNHALWEIAKSKNLLFVWDELLLLVEDRSGKKRRQQQQLLLLLQEKMGFHPDVILKEIGGVAPLGVVLSCRDDVTVGIIDPSMYFEPTLFETVAALHRFESHHSVGK